MTKRGKGLGSRAADLDQELDWSYELIYKLSIMLSHGAEFVYTADDAFNPSIDRAFDGMVFPQPGPPTKRRGAAPGRARSSRPSAL